MSDWLKDRQAESDARQPGATIARQERADKVRGATETDLMQALRDAKLSDHGKQIAGTPEALTAPATERKTELPPLVSKNDVDQAEDDAGAGGGGGGTSSPLSVAIGTVTTLAEGASATASVAIVAGVITFSFGIPVGATGAAGDDGAAGATGPKGDQGDEPTGGTATCGEGGAITITFTYA